MKEYIKDIDEITKEREWEQFFLMAIKEMNTEWSLHTSTDLYIGHQKDFDYVTFKDTKCNCGYFDDMLISREKNTVKGVTKLNFPLILVNMSQYLVMSYDETKKSFSRETYTITKTQHNFYEYDYDKRVLLADSIFHIKNKRRSSVEYDLEEYVNFKNNILPQFVSQDVSADVEKEI